MILSHFLRCIHRTKRKMHVKQLKIFFIKYLMVYSSKQYLYFIFKIPFTLPAVMGPVIASEDMGTLSQATQLPTICLIFYLSLNRQYPITLFLSNIFVNSHLSFPPLS